MKKVGVIRGGTNKHYNSSLKNGGEIIFNISENLGKKWKPEDVLIDRVGQWHLNGKPVMPNELKNKIDMAWNTAEPEVSISLNSLGIPYVGNDYFSSALESSREMLREHIKSTGVNMARSIVLPVYQKDFDGPRELYAVKKAKEVHGKFGGPWIIKSFTEEKSMGIHLAKTFPELVDAIADGVAHNQSIIVEEFIPGKVASLHSVPGFRGENIYTFPFGHTFGTFLPEEKEKLVSLAKTLHNHLGAKHYLKLDFVMTARGKVYLLQIESTPDLHPESHFSQVVLSVGANTHNVIEHILDQAL